MKNLDKFLNACESIKYLDSVSREGDTYTLIGCGKTLQLKERFDNKGNREVLLWSKAEPTNLHKVVGNDVEKILPRLIVQHFTGLKNIEYTDHENHVHLFEDVGFFPASVHNNMTRFSDATGRKWICSASGGNAPNVTLAFYKLLYDGRTDMSAMMLPRLEPLDDVKVIKSGVGGRQVEVFELPTFPEPSEDFIISSIDDLKREVPNYEDFMMFPHQGDVPAYGHSIVSGMVVSSADRPFIASAERNMRGFIGSSAKRPVKSGILVDDQTNVVYIVKSRKGSALYGAFFHKEDAEEFAASLQEDCVISKISVQTAINDLAMSSAKRPVKSGVDFKDDLAGRGITEYAVSGGICGF